MKNTTGLVLVLGLLAAGGTSTHGQEVFTNGVDVHEHYVENIGMILLESFPTNQSDIDVRGLAPSLGQMAGVNPTNGAWITVNGDLLTLRPKMLSLSNETNRQFVVAAAQIQGSGTVLITYNGTSLVLSVKTNSLTTSQLNLSSVDARYVEQAGDTLSGTLSLGGNDLSGVGQMLFNDGSTALSAGSYSDCRFSGSNAGDYNTAWGVVGLGSHAGYYNSGDNVNGLGYGAASFNYGSDVNAMGYFAGADNMAYSVNAFGYFAAIVNYGHDVNGLGDSACMFNIGSRVNGLGLFAAYGNDGDNVNALGYHAAYLNVGDNLTSLGSSAGSGNSGAYCTFIGCQAGKNNTNDNVIAIGENIQGSDVQARTVNLDGDLYLHNCNGKGGGTKLHFASGASMTTTSNTFAFGQAALLIARQGDIEMGSYTNGLKPF